MVEILKHSALWTLQQLRDTESLFRFPAPPADRDHCARPGERTGSTLCAVNGTVCGFTGREVLHKTRWDSECHRNGRTSKTGARTLSYHFPPSSKRFGTCENQTALRVINRHTRTHTHTLSQRDGGGTQEPIWFYNFWTGGKSKLFQNVHIITDTLPGSG